MLNVENLKKNILIDLQKIAEEGCRSHSLEIQSGFTAQLPELGAELMDELGNLYSQYKKLEETGETSTLEWIYFSFLRSGVVTHSPCYRIDFYDARGCVSDVECGGAWRFSYIFDSYYMIEKKVMERVGKQAHLRSYEADGLLCELAGYFRQMADERIPQIIHCIREEIAEMLPTGHGVKIMLGEFLDHGDMVTEILPK